MADFDLKSFMINEGLTRVSRDRNRLLNERSEETLSDYTYDVRPGRQWEDVWGRGMTPEDLDIFRNEGAQEDMYLQDGNIESLDEIEPGRYIIISDAEADASEIVPLMGFEDPEDVPWTYYFTIRAHSNPYDNEGVLMYRISEGSELNESDDHEVATRYRNITMADPKNADSTKSARNTQHGSTSHHYTGLGSANQDAEHRKEQQKQNAKLKKQMGIKTKHMSKEDWITKRLNKELGI